MGKYKTVEDYVKDQEDWKGKIINQLREILKKSAPMRSFDGTKYNRGPR